MRLLPYIAAAVLGIPLLAAAATTRSPSLCQQLATQVRQSAATVWKSDGSLNPWVRLAKVGEPHKRGPRGAAAHLLLHKMFEAQGLLGPMISVLEIEHLPGTRVYMGSTVAGTEECQSSMFAEIGSDGLARALSNPPGYTGPCWNVRGNVGAVLGHPAYIEMGTLSMTTDDTLTRVTPWTSSGWGHMCQLTVRLNYKFHLGKRFCGNQAVCRSANAIAVDVAQKYLSYLKLPARPMRTFAPYDQVPDFSYQRSVAMDPQGSAAVTRAWHILARQAQAQYPGAGLDYALDTSAFPTFGYHDRNDVGDDSFSYVQFAMFPLMLNGRLYVGAVGHNGVGWREGSHVLFAVYEDPTRGQRDLVPLAGFSVARVPNGLKEADVTVGGSTLPAHELGGARG